MSIKAINAKQAGEREVELTITQADGAVISLICTPAELMDLSRYTWMIAAASNRQLPEHRAVLERDPDLRLDLTLPAMGIETNTDLLASQVTMVVVDDRQVRYGFGLSPELAAAIGPQLVKEAGKIRAASLPKA